MKIDELKDEYLNNLLGLGRQESTKKAYDFDLKKFIAYLETREIFEADAVTTLIIENYRDGLQLLSSTKQRRTMAIKNFFSFLYRREYIQKDPGINVSSIKVSQNVPEYLSREQYTALIETIKNDKSKPYYKQRDLMIVDLLLKTGLRRAEIVGLNVGDVEMSKLILRVKRKGNRKTEVRIHYTLVDELKLYLNSINRNPNEPLFMSKRGNRLSPSSVWHLVKGYARVTGLNNKITVHSLRHTFATSLLSEAMPLPYIQKLMDHRSPQTTSRYLHVQDNELTDAFNRVTFGERG